MTGTSLELSAVHAVEILDSRAVRPWPSPSPSPMGRPRGPGSRRGRRPDPGRPWSSVMGTSPATEERVCSPRSGTSTVNSPSPGRALVRRPRRRRSGHARTDGTPNKGRLGANGIIGISMATHRAYAASARVPLWQSLATGRVGFVAGAHRRREAEKGGWNRRQTFPYCGLKYGKWEPPE